MRAKDTCLKMYLLWGCFLNTRGDAAYTKFHHFIKMKEEWDGCRKNIHMRYKFHYTAPQGGNLPRG